MDFQICCKKSAIYEAIEHAKFKGELSNEKRDVKYWLSIGGGGENSSIMNNLTDREMANAGLNRATNNSGRKKEKCHLKNV